MLTALFASRKLLALALALPLVLKGGGAASVDGWLVDVAETSAREAAEADVQTAA